MSREKTLMYNGRFYEVRVNVSIRFSSVSRSGSWSLSMSARALCGMYCGLSVRVRVRVGFWVGVHILKA